MDYEFQSTFWEDFSIAEHFGIAAIKETYNKCFDLFKDNYIYLTELVIVLNWKLWQWYRSNGDCKESELYNDLWAKTDRYAIRHLKGTELEYYVETTD